MRFDSGMRVWNPFLWHKIGHNQVKYRSGKLTNNPKQGLDRIYHCVKKQAPMWFGSGMRVRKQECVKRANKQMNEQTYDADKNNSPTPALQAGRGSCPSGWEGDSKDKIPIV